jgi:HEPN domain-containing protein
MPTTLFKTDFVEYSDMRLREAVVLLDSGEFSGAYYLLGYAVECALKACIASKTKALAFPPRTAKGYYTHDIDTLVATADLTKQLQKEVNRNPEFGENWGIAVKWNEESRYNVKSAAEAKALYRAVSDDTNGILLWIKQQY